MSLQRLSSDLTERVSSVFERQRSGVESSYITRTASNRSTVSRAEAEKRGVTHVTAARTWKNSGQLHDEATALWVIPSCVENPMTSIERAEDAQRRAATAAAFLSSIQRSTTDASAVEGEDAGACFMSALLTAHSSDAIRSAPPTKVMPPTPVAAAPKVNNVPVTPSPAPITPAPIAVKRERSPSAEAAHTSVHASAPPAEERPAEKKAPRTEAPKGVPATTTATKPAPKTSKSKKAPVAGQMKLNFAKLMPAANPVAATTPKPTVAVAEEPVAQIILPPAPPPISSENDELFMPEEGDIENQQIVMPTMPEPTSAVAEKYEVREGERQANETLSSVNDDLVMGSFDEPSAPTPKPTDAFGALMGKPKATGATSSSTPKATTAAAQASANTMKQSSMMGALFNPALVAFQKQFEKRTKNLMKRKPDGSTEFQQITIRVRLGPLKDGKPTVLEEMTEEEYRQQCDVVIQQNKAGGAPLQQMATNVTAAKNPFISH